MTNIDNIDESSKLNLTEDSSCPGQNLEGKKTDDEYWQDLVNEYDDKLRRDYSHELEYITLSELKQFLELERWLQIHPNYSYERHLKFQQYEQISSQIDWFYVVQKAEEDFQKKRHQKILEKKLNKCNNRYQLGSREFTFTYSPKWFDDSEARLRMSSAIQKICKYYKDEIIQLRAVGEVGTNGLSHIHCFYKLRGGNKITDKNFKRAWSMWDTHVKQGPTGHKGGHHANVRNEADFQGYIDKDIENAWFEVNIDNSQDPSN